MTYTQCKLKRNNSYMVSYIPSHGAVKGYRVEIDNKFWDVIDVYGSIEKEDLFEFQKKTRDKRNFQSIR